MAIGPVSLKLVCRWCIGSGTHTNLDADESQVEEWKSGKMPEEQPFDDWDRYFEWLQQVSGPQAPRLEDVSQPHESVAAPGESMSRTFANEEVHLSPRDTYISQQRSSPRVHITRHGSIYISQDGPRVGGIATVAGVPRCRFVSHLSAFTKSASGH